MKRLLFACTASAITILSSSASAQVWLQDRAATQGEGIRSGDIELHPGIGAELGYDSNFFQAPANTPGYPVVGTAVMRVTPSFSVSTLTANRAAGAEPPKVTFRAGAALAYEEYLTNTAALQRNRDFGVIGDMALAIAPGRPLGFNLLDNFNRTAQPFLVADGTAGLNRDENRVAGEFVYTRPGGLLDWRLGYAFNNVYFEDPTVSYLNDVKHEIYTRGRWKFLPRTALVYDGSAQFIRYSGNVLPNSSPLRSRIGLAGLVGDRISVMAMIGWGASFYDTSRAPVGQFDSVIGQAEVRYFFGGTAPEAGQQATTTMSSFAVGFTRDFVNNFFTAFYEQDRGYVSLSGLLAQRFYLSLQAGFSAIRYSPMLDTQGGATTLSTGAGQGAFTDTRADASLYGEYRLTNWLAVTGTLQYLGEFSNHSFQELNSSMLIPLGFSRFQGLAGLRAFW